LGYKNLNAVINLTFGNADTLHCIIHLNRPKEVRNKDFKHPKNCTF